MDVYFYKNNFKINTGPIGDKDYPLHISNIHEKLKELYLIYVTTSKKKEIYLKYLQDGFDSLSSCK